MGQHLCINIDCHDVTRDLGHLQREPSVAAAKVDGIHARREADQGQDLCGVRKERLPPGGVRHLRALKKSRQVAAHYLVFMQPLPPILSRSAPWFTASTACDSGALRKS
jgi:hypothetical protein